MIFGNAVAIDGAEVGQDIRIDGGELGLSNMAGGDLGVYYQAGGHPPFEGPYEYTPVFEDIIVPAQDKWMLHDVTFRAIPVLEVSNPQGGITVTIGG